MWNKLNHFCEMKGDVGMSRHEKEGEQEDMSILRQDNLIPTSLFFNKITCTHLQVFLFVLKLHPQYPQTTEQLHST